MIKPHRMVDLTNGREPTIHKKAEDLLKSTP